MIDVASARGRIVRRRCTRRGRRAPLERVARIGWLLVPAMAIAACRAAEGSPPVEPGEPGATRFPGASAVLSGFDPAEPGSDWRAGDRVLFALSAESSTRRRSKLIELELLGPLT